MISELGYDIYLRVTTCWLWWWEVNSDQDDLARTILTISVPPLLFLSYKWISSYAYLPPGPYGLPILGYLPFLGPNLHEIFTQMSHKYGPIFSLQLGSKLHVVVNSTDLVKVVTRDLDQTFANRSPPVTARVLSYGASDIAWSNNNAYWRNMRKILVSHVMSNANLNASRSFRTTEVRKTVSEIYSNMGKKMDVNEIAFNTLINVVTSILWGRSKSGEGKDSSDLGDGFREIQFKMVSLLGAPNVSDFFPMLSRFDLQKRKRDMQKLWEYLDGIFDKIIEKRMEDRSGKIVGAGDEEDGREDFLNIMLELKEQKADTRTSFDIIQIKAQLLDIINAATDTTTAMVEWVMAEILNNPCVMKEVQTELSDVIGINSIVEESHLHKLTYLEAVIKETFRLHPPLPLLIQRCPDESCMVGEYLIPKDTIVYINVWAIHRDPNNWTNPLEFKPERFLNGNWDYNGSNLKFLPFGLGRRICPGIPLGDKMLIYILASLMHSFEWKVPEDDLLELSDEFGFATKKKKPLVAIPYQRLPDAILYMG